MLKKHTKRHAHGDMGIDTISKLILPLVFLVVFINLIGVQKVIFGEVLDYLDYIMKWISDLLGLFGDRIAVDSTTALTCAVDLVAVNSGMISFSALVTPPACSKGKLKSLDPYNLCFGDGDHVCVECQGPPASEFKCKVVNFELPQKTVEDTIDGSAEYGSANYIAAVGDPKYVVFNEKFPDAASQNWNLLGEDFAIMFVATAGAANAVFDCALPAAGKVISKAGSKVTQNTFTGALKSNLDTAAKVGSIAADVIIFPRGIMKLVKYSLTKTAELSVNNIAKPAFTLARKKFNAVVGKLDADTTVDLAMTVRKSDLDDLSINVVTYRITKDTIGVDKEIEENAKKNLIKELNSYQIKHKGAEITADNVDKYVDDITIKSAADDFDTFYKIKYHDLPLLRQTMVTGTTTAVKLPDNMFLKFSESVKNTMPSSTKITEAADTIISSADEGDITSKYFIAQAEESIKELEKANKIKSVRASLKGLGLSGRSIDPTTPQGKVTYGLVLAMYGANKLENMLAMRDPSNCGTNTMCLHGYNWILNFLSGMKYKGAMSTQAKNIWLELEGSEDDGLFYLASPCKANLTVTKDTCECAEYYDTSKIQSTVVLTKLSVNDPISMALCFATSFNSPGCRLTTDQIKVHLGFPYSYKGPDISFKYFVESSVQSKNINLKNNYIIDSPLMLEQALQSMDSDQLKAWIDQNAPGNTDSSTISYYYTQIINNNIEQGTLYKTCVKGDWWKFWEDSEQISCIKIKATPVEEEGKPANFCYEKSWDRASQVEVGLFAGEIIVGVGAASLAGGASGGIGAVPAYCIATTAVSAGGAWLLAGEMAEDKWPNGINQ